MELWQGLQELPGYGSPLQILVLVLVALSMGTLAARILKKMNAQHESEYLYIGGTAVAIVVGFTFGTLHYHNEGLHKEASALVEAYVLETEEVVAVSPIKFSVKEERYDKMVSSRIPYSTHAAFTGVDTQGKTVEVALTWLPLDSKPVDATEIPAKFNPVTIKVTKLSDLSSDAKDSAGNDEDAN